MVTIKTNAIPASLSPGQDQSLVALIRRGSLLPIISGDALEDIVLQGHEKLVSRYAQEIGYPLQDRTELYKMVKYRSLSEGLKDNAAKERYLDLVANYLVELAAGCGTPERVITEACEQAEGLQVSDFAKLLGFPRLGEGAANPLEILANLPLPIFVTTTPYTFIEEALRHAGKHPETEFCRWHPGLDSAASVFASGEYQPDDKRPLVYHLYGLDRYADSLVLTEDDYLDFLMAVSQGRGKDIDPLHDVVKGAFQSKALLLMGFSLASWAFRVLYRVLIKPMPDSIYQRYCCLQLVPNQDEQRYYEDYLRKEARFDRVYWKDIETFCRENLPVEV